jgi:predicted component of type VI protein secretion system
LISNRSPAQGEAQIPVEQKALNLRNKLVDLHDVLHEYREVEAREKLIATMVKQVEEAERVEAALAR